MNSLTVELILMILISIIMLPIKLIMWVLKSLMNVVMIVVFTLAQGLIYLFSGNARAKIVKFFRGGFER